MCVQQGQQPNNFHEHSKLCDSEGHLANVDENERLIFSTHDINSNK